MKLAGNTGLGSQDNCRAKEIFINSKEYATVLFVVMQIVATLISIE
jgi:hypothetical protein